MRDNVVPRMQQWPLDIPQWHITSHPQLSAKIIILYVFHTDRRIKSKFPNHTNSIYLSDIYEEIIHHFSHVGYVLRHKRLCYRGVLETVDLQHIDSKKMKWNESDFRPPLCTYRLNWARRASWGYIYIYIDSNSFPSKHGTLTKCWFNVGQRRIRWSNIKTALGQFLVRVVSCNKFSRWY